MVTFLSLTRRFVVVFVLFLVLDLLWYVIF